MFGTTGNTAVFFRFVGAVFLVYAVVSMSLSVAAGLEARRVAELRELDQSIDPVALLILDERVCFDGGFIVSGFLDKTKYPNEREANFKGQLIYGVEEPPNRYPWRQTVEGDETPQSRRYGPQSIDFVILGPCDLVFTVDTRHESPLTGDIRSMRWGPFYPPLD